MEVLMTMMATVEAATDPVMAALISDLEIEFGSDVGAALAPHFLAAEEADFYWQARTERRNLGQYGTVDGDDGELDRVAVIGFLAGRWYVAAALIDGAGDVRDILNLRRFESAWDAHEAFDRVH